MTQKKFLDNFRDEIQKGFVSDRISPNNIAELQKYKRKSEIPSMENFYEAIENFENKKTFELEKPSVGYFCNIVPEEIILACDLHPVRLCCEDQVCAQAGEEIAPGDICCVIKSICGKFYGRLYENLNLVIVPGTCDPKTKLAELISPLKEIYFLDPGRDSDYLENAAIWESRYTELFDFLKKRFHKNPGRTQLISACHKTNKRTEIFRKIYQLRTDYPDSINVFDYYIMIYASFFMEIELWNDFAEKVYSQALEKKKTQNKPRILLVGTPVIFPNFKIIDVLEQSGLAMATDIQCTSFGRFFNPVEIDEDTESGIIRVLALKNIAGSICPCLLNLEKMANLIIDTVNQYNLDGVIYYNLRLCQVFEIQTAILRQILKQRNIPFISIKTDLGKEDTGQLKTRLEAFREMLESHRK
ncbi:MAG: 2-hydroxyacyl-CoA dehydratase family protein [Candidatus Omnitrophica bacterium]|nr:2-hydroxyacyl-CoA dehydratase family protein [Candidatus Omnitrophota bacterium]